MNENEMGYRGSKSVCVSRTHAVKEQRVDGSWLLAKLESNPQRGLDRTNGARIYKKINWSSNGAGSLRCTLKDFERNRTTVQRGPGYQAGPSTKVGAQLGNSQVRIPSCCGFATGPADLRRSKQIIKRFSHTSRLNP